MATEVKSYPIPENVENETPTSGRIMIVPYPPSMLRDPSDSKYRWGGITNSGHMAINKKPIDGWSYMGASLTLDGSGAVLDMSNESHRRLYMIYKYADQWKGVVSERKDKRYPNSKFYFQNNELEIQNYLKQMRASDEMVDRIRALRPEEVVRLAMWFGIGGSDDFKKGSLRKMTESEDGMKRLQEVLLNPDREIMELVAVAQSKGDSNSKYGLWENKATGVFYWNSESIGLGREGAIVYLKKNVELQREMRNLYLSEPLAEQAQPQTATKPNIPDPDEKIQTDNPLKNLKVVDPTVDKSKKGWYINIEDLKKDYETEKDFFMLGEKYKDPDTGSNTHFQTIKRMLKEAGVVK